MGKPVQGVAPKAVPVKGITTTVYSADVLKLFKDIRINTGNSKTGPSWSIPEGESCPGKTTVCANNCYVKQGRMGWAPARSGRSRNFKTALELLKIGGSDLLVHALNAAISRAQCKTLRIHDSGDFFNIPYIKGWLEVVRLHPEIDFWAYTRSWRVPNLVPALRLLAQEPNLALWISADIECWIEATIEGRRLEWAGVAFMETEGSADIAATLNHTFKKRFINFPEHGAFGRVNVDIQEGIRNCPAVTRKLPHDETNPACLRCQMCLPKGVK